MASQNQKNWYFFIAGKGKLENKLKQIVATKKLTERVLFLGFIKNVLPYVQGADLFVLPSFYEGMPNAVMEAMGLGKCCVVTSVNGNNELIDNKKEGILVQPHDALALYNGICRVAENATDRQLMGKNALAKMRNSFSEDKMITELEAFLEKKSKRVNNN
jgi:glycosyltransferase involved in cell wall biosynthesis